MSAESPVWLLWNEDFIIYRLGTSTTSPELLLPAAFFVILCQKRLSPLNNAGVFVVSSPILPCCFEPHVKIASGFTCICFIFEMVLGWVFLPRLMPWCIYWVDISVMTTVALPFWIRKNSSNTNLVYLTHPWLYRLDLVCVRLRLNQPPSQPHLLKKKQTNKKSPVSVTKRDVVDMVSTNQTLKWVCAILLFSVLKA